MTSNVLRLPADEDRLDISYVSGPDVAQVWPLVGEHVAIALDDTMTAKEVYDAVMERSAELWVVHGKTSGVPVATLAIRANQRGERRILEVLTAGGSGFRQWRNRMQALLEHRMRELECVAMRAWCRRGMGRWLKDLGWREHQVVMEWRSDGR